MLIRQWPEVYDLCHTFLHVELVRKHTDMIELHAFCMQLEGSEGMDLRSKECSGVNIVT